MKKEQSNKDWSKAKYSTYSQSHVRQCTNTYQCNGKKKKEGRKELVSFSQKYTLGHNWKYNESRKEGRLNRSFRALPNIMEHRISIGRDENENGKNCDGSCRKLCLVILFCLLTYTSARGKTLYHKSLLYKCSCLRKIYFSISYIKTAIQQM
jgi:hypothetical protein